MSSPVSPGGKDGNEPWTPLRVLEWTTRRFETAGHASPRLDAQVLLAHVLRCDRVHLYTQFDKPLGEDELAAFRELVRRRLAGEPTAYLVGEKEFWSLPLAVGPRVLVPRPDTETLVQVALELAPRSEPIRIADIGTGSGAVAIALAVELPAAALVATDVSGDALEVAAQNAARHGVADRIQFRMGDLTAALPDGAQFHLLVANLPYIPTADIDALPPEVRAEPRAALDGGPDGLELVRRLVGDAAARLVAGGHIALEHAPNQARAVADLLADEFDGVAARKDLAGHPRVSYARAFGPPTLLSP
jgi:release factor glutamine methyltransferase